MHIAKEVVDEQHNVAIFDDIGSIRLVELHKPLRNKLLDVIDQCAIAELSLK